MDNISLYFGYQMSKEHFAVLWKQGDTSVKIDSTKTILQFFLSHHSKEHKLEISREDISRPIELRRPSSQTTEFLLFQLFSAPQIYVKEIRPGARDSWWVRDVDFTPMCCIGQSSALCVELPQGGLPKFLKNFAYYKENKGSFILQEASTFSCNSDHVPIVNPPRDFDLPYKIMFKINSLVQHGYLPGSAIDVDFYQLVASKKMEYIESALNKLYRLKGCCYEPVKWLSEQYSMERQLPKSSDIDLKGGLVYIYRVLITPCKVYFCGPEVNLSNRVLRNYSDDIDNFLRVTFVDEDLSKVHSSVLSAPASSGNEDRRTGVYERILSTLRNGIVIGDKKFEFLAFSSSQLKENSVWMFASRAGLTAADIREWMGDFHDIRNVGKYAARLGQSFGSSRETVSIEVKEMEILPDVEIETDGITYCFSDGIGKISAELASIVANKCGCKSDVPSAFQIRYGGYKGVVAVDPTSSRKLSLRKSMYKFKSQNTKLDVLAWSKCHYCFLNRQIITLLSNLGVRDQVFEKMQKEVINGLNGMLTDPLEAQKVLEWMFPGETTSILRKMLACGYKSDDEPFLAMMVRVLRASRLMDLRLKSRIFVQNGRSMMGCLDETRTLEYGHVFVQISRFDRELCNNSSLEFTTNSLDPDSFIFEGKVVVAKNPCLHPGDVRVLRAVNVPALHHMVDCVVFPQQGKRPHPNECSGSDLDGDMYFVCWDPDLIPPLEVQPMNHNAAIPSNVLDRDVTVEEVQEYFVKHMVSDSLGMIANAHTVYADKEPRGALSKKCIELAKLHSMAVDSAKTGEVVQLPPHLHVREYPDFMEKPDKPSYISQRVIGKLFREMKDIASEKAPTEPFNLGRMKKYYDPDMKVDGYKDYISEALQYKKRYNYELGVLMDSYGIKTEAEILSSSNIVDMSKPSHRKKDPQAVNDAVMSLRRKARKWFKKGKTSEGCDYAKASAWYHVTYHYSYRQEMDGDNFLSFPWCICDELVHIKRENASKRALRRSSLQKLFYRLFLSLLFFLCLLLFFVHINKY